MNIFKYEFMEKRKSIIIWSLSLSAFMIFYMAFFPTVAKDSQAFSSIMESFPEDMLSAMGIKEGMSIANLIGYFALTFNMIQLALAIQAANYGFSILTEEERELTADFLLSKPVSRGDIYISKVAAALIGLLISGVFLGISSMLALALFNGGEVYQRSNLIKLLISIPIFQMVFLSLGILISLLFKRIRSVISFSMALALGLYIINALAGILDEKVLAYISPYFYFDPGTILESGEYDLKLMVLAFGITIISLVLSYVLYNKRDIDSI